MMFFGDWLQRREMLSPNKVALITGGAAGIGKATAERFIQEGARVIICNVNVQGGHQTADELGEL